MMLYSDTGGGKTTQIGELAEHVAITTGKPSLLYTMDRGGTETIAPHIEIGMVEVEDLRNGDPWVAIHAATEGRRWDASRKSWEPIDLSRFGLVGYETASSMSDELRMAMTKENAEGRGVGGKAAFTLKRDAGSMHMTVSNNTMVDYTVVQATMTQEMWRSQSLVGAGQRPIVWTSHINRGQDEETSQPIVGVALAGKALTGVIPRWFTYTFRLEAVPVPNARPKHILYIEEHTDTGLKGLGNARIPLASLPNFKPIIEPASVVQALASIRAAQAAAKESINARLKAAGVSFI